jgi:hypothetical protein
MKKYISLMSLVLLITINIYAQEPVISFLPGMVGLAATTPGYQMNAEVGTDFKIHIISGSDISFYCGGAPDCKKQPGYYLYDENGVTVLKILILELG